MIVVLFLSLVKCLPLRDKIALANSLIVGRSVQDLKPWTCGVCGDQNRPQQVVYARQNKWHVKAIITQYSDMVVLAFRHTQTLLNVLQDIAFVHQTHDDNTPSNCKVQGVMDKMWNSVREEIIGNLTKAAHKCGKNKLVITGVSLGGALAALSFIDIQLENLFADIKVVTFGAPRVGNKHWAAYFQERTNKSSLRYLIKNDPIPILPRCLWLCNYKQTGIKMACDKKAQKCVQNGKGFDHEQMEAELRDGKKHLQENDVGGLIDHIKNYPKIYNYTVEWDEANP